MAYRDQDEREEEDGKAEVRMKGLPSSWRYCLARPFFSLRMTTWEESLSKRSRGRRWGKRMSAY